MPTTGKIELKESYNADLVEALEVIVAGTPADEWTEDEIPGVSFDDDGVRLFRQPWMTDEQWTTVRTRMTAWLNAWLADWRASR